jgi:hypothetical protein
MRESISFQCGRKRHTENHGTMIGFRLAAVKAIQCARHARQTPTQAPEPAQFSPGKFAARSYMDRIFM